MNLLDDKTKLIDKIKQTYKSSIDYIIKKTQKEISPFHSQSFS